MTRLRPTASEIRDAGDRIAYHELVGQLRDRTPSLIPEATRAEFTNYGDWLEWNLYNADGNLIEPGDAFWIDNQDYEELLHQIAAYAIGDQPMTIAIDGSDIDPWLACQPFASPVTAADLAAIGRCT